MGNIVGIDLGTTNSVAAFKFAEVEVVTAPDNTPSERKLTRSVVALSSEELIVGEEAYRQLKAQPENVIVSIKRLMGRGFAESVVQQQLSRFGYQVTQSTEGTENSLSVWLNKKEYAPEDISAEILNKVRQNAQNYQIERGQTGEITQAVITVPAYFNDKQKYATQLAAQKAGLVVSELLPEPTAAAISYGFKPDSEDVKTILVYDFGGGTFDSSLITTDGNQFFESGTAGDLWLGGDDIDEKLMEFVKKTVEKQEDLQNIDQLINQMPHYQRVRFVSDLKIAVERAKIELSKVNSARVIPSTPLLDEIGMAVSIDVEITREKFEELILPLVERSLAICQSTIKYSDYPADMIDVVLLVGGSSQIPLIQRKVREVFGADKVFVHPRPLYAIAEGAAIVAAGLTEKVGTVSRDLFIQLVNEPRFRLVKQGDILPVRTSHTFKTEADGQRLIHFKFFSPDQVRENLDKVQEAETVGEMWLAFNEAYPKGTEILVTTELDEKNRSQQITAALKNNPSVRVSCSLSRGQKDEIISRQVEQIIEDLNREGKLTTIGVQKVYKIAGDVVLAANQMGTGGEQAKLYHDRRKVAEEKLKELENMASEDHWNTKYYISSFEWVLEYCCFLLTEGQEQRIKLLIGDLEKALNTNNISAMQKLAEDSEREYNNFPEQVRLIVLCRNAIVYAHQIDPTQARAMAGKFSQMLNALERRDVYEADRLCQELLRDLQPYLEKEIPTASIATGLSR